MESKPIKQTPCSDCDTRRTYAYLFDMHFSGEDCPYICERWNEYKKEQMNQERLREGEPNER